MRVRTGTHISLNFSGVLWVILLVSFGSAFFPARTFAVGFYTPPCKSEEDLWESQFEKLKKCLNQFIDSSKAGSEQATACLAEYQEAAKAATDLRFCFNRTKL